MLSTFERNSFNLFWRLKLLLSTVFYVTKHKSIVVSSKFFNKIYKSKNVLSYRVLHPSKSLSLPKTLDFEYSGNEFFLVIDESFKQDSSEGSGLLIF